MIYGLFYNGINWIGLDEESNAQIEKSAFKFGNEMIYPGQVINKLGSKARTSFEIGIRIKYIGRIKDENSYYLLFRPNDGTIHKTKPNLFEPQKYIYIGIITDLQQSIFLIQTSDNTFYDIKP